jgi:hypothetical protein
MRSYLDRLLRRRRSEAHTGRRRQGSNVDASSKLSNVDIFATPYKNKDQEKIMGYKFSNHSKEQLMTIHPFLQLIIIKALAKHDLKVRQGGRPEKEQWEAFNAGRSKLAPPKGKHLLRPDPSGQFDGLWSLAGDVEPFVNGKPLRTVGASFTGTEQAKFAWFLGLLSNIAEEVLEGTEWQLRFGVNWDMDAEILSDQDFDDWFHVELVWMGNQNGTRNSNKG